MRRALLIVVAVALIMALPDCGVSVKASKVKQDKKTEDRRLVDQSQPAPPQPANPQTPPPQTRPPEPPKPEAQAVRISCKGNEKFRDIEVAVGKSVEVEAKVYDKDGKPTSLIPCWEAFDMDKSGNWGRSTAIKIEPSVGAKVKIKVAGKGEKKYSRVDAYYIEGDKKITSSNSAFIKIK